MVIFLLQWKVPKKSIRGKKKNGPKDGVEKSLSENSSIPLDAF